MRYNPKKSGKRAKAGEELLQPITCGDVNRSKVAHFCIINPIFSTRNLLLVVLEEKVDKISEINVKLTKTGRRELPLRRPICDGGRQTG